MKSGGVPVRKVALFLAWAALIALILAWPFLTASLPASNERVAERLSGGWSGVLRLWVCDEMWPPGNGSFVPWLNTCIGRFERRHPGVYVQVSSVPLSVLRRFADGEVNPPDMMLLAPGMLPGADNLLPLSPDGRLPAFLRDAGQGHAAAVALGGYGWALNKTYLTEAPADWAALGEGVNAKAKRKNQRAFYWMDAQADGAFVSFSKAFLSLMADREVSEEARQPVKAGEGLNLGLTGEPEPTQAPRTTRLVRATLPKELPNDFRARESVLGDFASGRTAAALLSQREMQRLATLSGAGRAPDWTLEPAPYTDQVAFLAVADVPRQSLSERQALSLQLIDHLLSDESQKALTKAAAFRATPGEALYASRTGFAALERWLSAGAVQVPAAFDTNFRGAAKAAADELVRRSGGT
jgi:hypothetical protein